MVEFTQVDKSFGAQEILRAATFRINAGERAGVVGPNGAGKSTVFELIAGEISPDRGRVTVPSGIRMGYVHQDLSFEQIDTPVVEYVENAVPELRRIEQAVHELQHRFAENTVSDREGALRELGDLQTSFETMGGYNVRSQAEVALGGLGFSKEDFTRPLREFSGGWQMRAELARVIVSDPALLLLDEPSNYLDIPAIEWLQRFLREFRGTLLMISHDRYLLNSLTTATLEIAHAEATRYAGNYDYYANERETRVRQRESAQKNQDRRREQIERFVDRFRAKNTKATQVQSKIKMLERMESINIPQRIVSPGRIRVPTPPHCGAEIIRLEDAGLSYDGEKWVLRGVNLAVGRGDKTALVGLNGTGKTSLLRIVAGKLPPGEGRRILGHKVIVGYQSQEFTDTMNPRDTALQTVKQAAPQATEQDVRRMLGSFGFSGEAVEKPVEVLSGGEKVRVAFARLLINPPNFLVLDEPTTHLDIAAREALEDALQSYAGTLCLVSHDIAFVRKVATSIIAMEPPGIRVYCGDYDYYREKHVQQTDGAPAATEEAQSTKSKQELRRERAQQVQERARLRRPLLDRVAKAEARVMKLDAEQTDLAEQLSDPHVRGYADLSRRLAHVAEDVERATAEWETAAEALQALDRESA